jgi:hypothetical protein
MAAIDTPPSADFQVIAVSCDTQDAGTRETPIRMTFAAGACLRLVFRAKSACL